MNTAYGEGPEASVGLWKKEGSVCKLSAGATSTQCSCNGGNYPVCTACFNFKLLKTVKIKR
jgi:hypothetical protein